MVPRKIRVTLCIETETDFLGFGSFWDRRFPPCAQSDQNYSHNFCYQERTVNIDVYVSVDTGFSQIFKFNHWAKFLEVEEER